MIEYEILGRVTARQDDRAPHLTPQHQLLLARLVYAKGAPVRKSELERAIWGQGIAPTGRLKSLVYELRGLLRDVAPDAESVTGGGEAYQFPLEDRQVDAFRFAAKLDEAGNSAGMEQARLMQEALDEWGPRASGLFGGDPLLGLEGGWAGGVRRKLRARYRDAVIDSLRRDAWVGDCESVLRRCARLAADDQEDLDRRDPQDAMRDNEFLVLWLRAAYQSGQPERAEQVLLQAKDVAARSGKPVNPDLERRAQMLREETSRRAVPLGAATPAPACSISPASDRRTMSETINFNNNAGSVAGPFQGDFL